MQKLFKSKLFVFILGVSMSLGLTSVFAITYSLFAQDVGFSPTDIKWDVNNVDDAINNLY